MNAEQVLAPDVVRDLAAVDDDRLDHVGVVGDGCLDRVGERVERLAVGPARRARELDRAAQQPP